MGWRDRDYAQLRPDELAELYGVPQPAPAGRAVSTRLVVWSCTALVCAASAGFALTHRETAPPPPPAPQLPTALYGDALPATSAFGPDAVCTEYELETSGGWRCDTALVNSGHLPVYAPARYVGACAHLQVVERSWVCLGEVPTPVPASSANS